MNINKEDLEVAVRNDNKYQLYLYFKEIADVISNKYRGFDRRDMEEWKQNAILRCFTNLHKYDPIKQRAFSYFYKVIQNEIFYNMRLQKQKKKVVRYTQLLDNHTYIDTKDEPLIYTVFKNQNIILDKEDIKFSFKNMKKKLFIEKFKRR